MIKNFRWVLLLVVLFNIIATNKNREKLKDKLKNTETNIAKNMKKLKSELQKNLNSSNKTELEEEEESIDDEILKIPEAEEADDEEDSEESVSNITKEENVGETALNLSDDEDEDLEEPEETEKVVKTVEKKINLNKDLEPSSEEDQLLTETPEITTQQQEAIENLDTSISEENPENVTETPKKNDVDLQSNILENNLDSPSDEEITVENSDLLDYKNHTSKLHEISSDIHSRIKKINKSDKDYITEYNKYREKLSKLSQIYKQKYPTCLPVPVYLLEKKSGLGENKKTKECRYAYYLGYNVVINWIEIVHPVNLTREEAWKRIEKESLPANLLNFENDKDRVLNFKLSGKCFAKGMKSSLIRNFKKKVKGKSIHSINNPIKHTEKEIENMKIMMNEITKQI